MGLLIQITYGVVIIGTFLYLFYFTLDNLGKLDDKESFITFFSYFSRILVSAAPLLLVGYIQLNVQFSLRVVEIAKTISCSIATVLIVSNLIKTIKKVKSVYK